MLQSGKRVGVIHPYMFGFVQHLTAVVTPLLLLKGLWGTAGPYQTASLEEALAFRMLLVGAHPVFLALHIDIVFHHKMIVCHQVNHGIWSTRTIFKRRCPSTHRLHLICMKTWFHHCTIIRFLCSRLATRHNSGTQSLNQCRSGLGHKTILKPLLQMAH